MADHQLRKMYLCPFLLVPTLCKDFDSHTDNIPYTLKEDPQITATTDHDGRDYLL